MIARRNTVEQLPTIAQDPNKFDVLLSAQEFRTHLIESIRLASKRIYIVALYLENDDAGREILTELYNAKQRNRVRYSHLCRLASSSARVNRCRGLCRNATLYCDFKQRYQHAIPVHGIPVRGREVFGVLHLKGFIIDDQVIYSGASINNVYLHYQERYRFDRYHTLDNPSLADTMVNFIQGTLLAHPAVNELSCADRPKQRDQN